MTAGLRLSIVNFAKLKRPLFATPDVSGRSGENSEGYARLIRPTITRTIHSR